MDSILFISQGESAIPFRISQIVLLLTLIASAAWVIISVKLYTKEYPKVINARGLLIMILIGFFIFIPIIYSQTACHSIYTWNAGIGVYNVSKVSGDYHYEVFYGSDPLPNNTKIEGISISFITEGGDILLTENINNATKNTKYWINHTTSEKVDRITISATNIETNNSNYRLTGWQIQSLNGNFRGKEFTTKYGSTNPFCDKYLKIVS